MCSTGSVVFYCNRTGGLNGGLEFFRSCGLYAFFVAFFVRKGWGLDLSVWLVEWGEWLLMLAVVLALMDAFVFAVVVFSRRRVNEGLMAVSVALAMVVGIYLVVAAAVHAPGLVVVLTLVPVLVFVVGVIDQVAEVVEAGSDDGSIDRNDYMGVRSNDGCE